MNLDVYANKKVEINNINFDSVYLVLDLEENVNFDFNDIDEVKKVFPQNYVELLYTSDSNYGDYRIEKWNLHTYSDKIIDRDKISLLSINDNPSASNILKKIAMDNLDYVKEKCPFLYEYLKYVDSENF